MRAAHAIYVVLFVALFLAPALPAHARGCTGDWSYSVEVLQEARRRLKSSAHQTRVSRVECGQDILAGLESAALPQPTCETCIREYIQLLRDLIAFTRAAAEGFSEKETSQNYYSEEINLRKKLGDFLVSTEDTSLVDLYWAENFLGMSDAMQRIYRGKELHQEALLSRGRVLKDRSFESWAKAIRSCEEWDFSKGDNPGLNKVKPILLCADECRSALVKIRERAKSGQAKDKDAVTDLLDSILPALEQCPTETRP